MEQLNLQYADALQRTFTAIRLTFNKLVDATSAVDLNNYQLSSVGKRPKPLVLQAAELGKDGRTVTLRLPKAAKVGAAQLVVLDGVTDRDGKPLDGDLDGNPGGDHTALFGNRLTIVEPDLDRASLAVTRGLMVLTNGEHLALADLLPGSVLTGTIKAAKFGSDRIVHLASAAGLDAVTAKLPTCTPAKPQDCLAIGDVSAEIVDLLLQSGKLSARGPRAKPPSGL